MPEVAPRTTIFCMRTVWGVEERVVMVIGPP
jgi:hypothetical protein